MSGMPKLDTAIAAGGVVEAADEIMRGIRDNREDKSGTKHYVTAAVAVAIALGAYAMLRKDEGLDEKHHHSYHHHGHDHDGHDRNRQHDDSGHVRDLVAETAGAYALGRQMLGHNDWKILKLVAEGLGAAAFAQEADRDLVST